MRLRSTALDATLPGTAFDGGSAETSWHERGPVPAAGQGAAEELEASNAHARADSTSLADVVAFDTTGTESHKTASRNPAAPLFLAPGDPWIDPRVVAAFEAESETVAHVRDLRGALTSRWHADAPDDRRAVALLGVDPSVDVATVAANLAVVSAQLGWRTLLVDGDLQASAQDALFRVGGDEGLATLLDAPGQGRALLQPTAIDRLMLLPAGPPPPNPVELLERQPLLEALDRRIGRHRLVLLSLSARAQSARFGAIDAILNGFDGAILVASRHRSGLRSLQRLTALLEEGNVPVLATAILP